MLVAAPGLRLTELCAVTGSEEDDADVVNAAPPPPLSSLPLGRVVPGMDDWKVALRSALSVISELPSIQQLAWSGAPPLPACLVPRFRFD